MRFLGPYTDADAALEATRQAVIQLIGADQSWPSHGNLPLAIAALVTHQKNELETLRAETDRLKTNLRHWREECGKLHAKLRHEEIIA